jgi:hypothetical protein
MRIARSSSTTSTRRPVPVGGRAEPLPLACGSPDAGEPDAQRHSFRPTVLDR